MLVALDGLYRYIIFKIGLTQLIMSRTALDPAVLLQQRTTARVTFMSTHLRNRFLLATVTAHRFRIYAQAFINLFNQNRFPGFVHAAHIPDKS